MFDALTPIERSKQVVISQTNPWATMVVTSRMLAAHTSGYPVDVRARFWSNYYRSLKDITNEESRPRVSESYHPRGGITSQSSGPLTLPKSTYPLVLNTISPSVRPSCHLWSGITCGRRIRSDRPIRWRSRRGLLLQINKLIIYYNNIFFHPDCTSTFLLIATCHHM